MKYKAIPVLAAGLLALTLAGCGTGTTAAQTGAAATPETSPAAQATPAAQSTPAAQATPAGQSAVITEDDAKNAALEHAGLTADQVSFARAHQDWDDGRPVYDVEFYTADYQEYDYEIDALTGAVLSYDYDAEYYGGQSGTGTTITAEEAKAMALAKVPGATEADIWEFSTERDDGRSEYEGEIIYDGMKYEFEIDGYSGTIRSWEAEARRG